MHDDFVATLTNEIRCGKVGHIDMSYALTGQCDGGRGISMSGSRT